MKRIYTIKQLLCLITLLSGNAFANEHLTDNNLAKIHEGKSIETLVVSGTRTAKLLSNSPVSVNVIEATEIELVAQGTLADALAIVPGVVVRRSVKDGYNVQMRGFGSDHVLILIDSQPLVSATGSSVDLDQINASDIAQIEVIQGAASVMYGSSAMGGVINIITRKNIDPKLTLYSQVSRYEDGDAQGSHPLSFIHKISAASDFADSHHSLSIKTIDQAGFDLDTSTVNQDAGSADKTFLNYSVTTEVNDLEGNLKYQLFDEKKRRHSSLVPGSNSIYAYESEVDQQQLDIAVSNPMLDENWRINARWIQHDELSGYNSSKRQTDIELTEIDGQKVWQSGKIYPQNANDSGSETVVGLLIHQDKLNQIKVADDIPEVDDKSRQSIEAFAQHNLIYQNYQILVGVRTQEDSDFGYHSAFRLSSMMNWQLDNTKIKWRAGVGQGYRVPNLKERFYIFDHSNLGYKVLGNESLTPEKSNSFTTSLAVNKPLWSQQANVNFVVSGHFSATKDLITTETNTELSQQENLDIAQYVNITEVDIFGFDLHSELTFTDWRITFDYAYVDSENKLSGNRLSARPRHQIKSSVSYYLDALEIDSMVYLIHQRDEAVPESYQTVINNKYTIANISLKQQFSEQFSWHLNVNNVFNTHANRDAFLQQQFDSRPISNREIVLGMSYQF